MEKSKYTIEIEKNGKLELVNTLYGSVIELDEEHQKIYRDILVGKDMEKHSEEIEILFEEGLIVESRAQEEAELRKQYEEMKLGRDTLNLTLLTTTACNMQCVYCFEHLKPVFPEVESTGAVMDFIEARYQKSPFKALNITWFGGEPLLNMEYIRDMSKKMFAFADKNHVEYNAKIITNGILLEHALAKELKNKWRISSAQITVDGMREEHNKRRPFGNKDGFTVIMNNIVSVYDDIQVILRVNVDKNNIAMVEELLIYLAQLGDIKDKVYIAFGKVVGDEPSCMTYTEFEKERLVLNELLEKYGFYFTIAHMSLNGSLLPCGALSDNSFVIYPNGDLYKCYEVAGRKEYCIGNLYNFQEEYENIIKERYAVNARCMECNKYPLCKGNMCPYRYVDSEEECIHSNESIYRTIETMKRVLQNA